MCFLFIMGIFHCYVSLLEGISLQLQARLLSWTKTYYFLSLKDGFEPKKTIMEGTSAVLKRAALGYLVLILKRKALMPRWTADCLFASCFAVPKFSAVT